MTGRDSSVNVKLTLICAFQIFTSFANLESKYLNLNARVCVDLLTRCLDSSCGRSHKVQLAAKTSSVHNLRTFVRNTNEQNTNQVQVVPVLQFLCDKFQDGLETQQLFLVEYCLEALLAILSELTDRVALSTRYCSFVWRTLCPVLLEFVGVPKSNRSSIDCREQRISEIRCVSRLHDHLIIYLSHQPPH